MAPEPTGRIDRSGAPVRSRCSRCHPYEMLTGQLPSRLPIRWSGCTATSRQPVPPCEQVSASRGPLSAIVMKLPRQDPRGRYQTASGSNRPSTCLGNGRRKGSPRSFPWARTTVGPAAASRRNCMGGSANRCLRAASTRRGPTATKLVLVSFFRRRRNLSVLSELHTGAGSAASACFASVIRLVQARTSRTRPLGTSLPYPRPFRSSPKRSGVGHGGRAGGAVGRTFGFLVHLVQAGARDRKQSPVVELPRQDRRTASNGFPALPRVFARKEHPLARFLEICNGCTRQLSNCGSIEHQPDVRHVLRRRSRNNESVRLTRSMRTLAAMRKAGGGCRDVAGTPRKKNTKKIERCWRHRGPIPTLQ